MTPASARRPSAFAATAAAILIVGAAGQAAAQGSDPCAAIAASPVATLTQVHDCYASFPASAEFKAEHTNALKTYFQAYPFTDLALNSAAPIFPSKVDINGELDRIAADSSITNQLEFYSRIKLMFASLNDAHAVYNPSCILSYRFSQPWHIAATYPEAGKPPVIKIVGGLLQSSAPENALWEDINPSQYANYVVLQVDGVDAVKAVQDYADKYANFARSADTRFNTVLASNRYSDGAWGLASGPFYQTMFLEANAASNRTYVLSPPSGGSSVTVTAPWVARRSNDVTFASGTDYYSKYCQVNANAPPSTQGSVQRSKPKPSDFYKPVPAEAYTSANAIAASVKPDPAGIAAFAHAKAVAQFGPVGQASSASFDINRPVVSDKWGAFYLLDDGETGVWHFATLSPEGDFNAIAGEWLGTIVAGLRALEQQGAKRLIIDVSGNGGGYACISNSLVEYLLTDTPIVIDQLRLTPAMRSMLKAGFYGPNANQLKPINTTDILSPTIRKTRGGIDGEFTGFFTFGCEGETPPQPLTKLAKGWSGDNIAILSDGGCGSACAVMIRSFRDAHKTRAFVYGGSSSTPFTPSSFEGGVISEYERLTAAALQVSTNPSLTPEDVSALPPAFTVPITGNLPITQGFSPLGNYALDWPVEWVPQPAETWVRVADPNDRAELWKNVAEAFKTGGGSSGTTPKATGTATVSPTAGSKSGSGKAVGGVGMGIVAVVVAALVM